MKEKKSILNLNFPFNSILKILKEIMKKFDQESEPMKKMLKTSIPYNLIFPLKKGCLVNLNFLKKKKAKNLKTSKLLLKPRIF